MKMKFRELTLRPDPNSPTINQLIDYKEFCGLSKDSSIDEEAGAVKNISVHELQKLLTHKNEKICIVDVEHNKSMISFI